MRRTTMSHFSDEVYLNRELLRNGRVLSIDPSSGSKSSMPGFAFFNSAQLISCGILEIDYRKPLWYKLGVLGSILRNNFPQVDALLVEQIAPFMSSAGTDFKNKAVVNLHKSIGALFASITPQVCIEVPIPSWKAWIRKKGIEDSYEKTDANDALVLGLVTLEMAGASINWDEFLI
jgi:hypothetical protein